jgi:hypothetical protein
MRDTKAGQQTPKRQWILGLALSGVMAVVSIIVARALTPILSGVFAPGSGGGAQMFKLIIFGPVVFCAYFVFVCSVVVAIWCVTKLVKAPNDKSI